MNKLRLTARQLCLMATLLIPAAVAAAAPAGLPFGIQTKQGFVKSVKKNQAVQGKVKSQHRLILEGTAGAHIDLEAIWPLEAVAADELVRTEIGSLRRKYEAPATPYMGDISAALGGCAKKFKPVEKELKFQGNAVSAIVMAADKKYSFGACDEQSYSHRGAFLAYFDPDAKRLFRWRIFSPRTASNQSDDFTWLEKILAEFAP